MKRFVFLVLLAGCAAQNTDPTHDTGTIIGEVSDPRNRAKLHTELASLYYSSANYGVALEELRAAHSADSSYAPAHGMYGLVYMQLKENGRAEEAFERALRLSPNDADINHNYGWFCARPGASRNRSSTSCRRSATRSIPRRGARIPRRASAR